MNVDPRLLALGLTGDAPGAAEAARELQPLGSLGGEAASRIKLAVGRLHDEIVETLSRLVQIPSISPNYPGQVFAEVVGGESRCAALLADVYRRAGADVEVFGSVTGRDNAVGRLRGIGRGRSLIFNGHTDVVPPGPPEAWSDGGPWSGRVGVGRVWGRGACDMKGGLVAQAMAALAIADSGLRLQGDLILEAVVGEEMMEHTLGTTACIERGYRADAAVVSEPSAPPSPLAVCPVSPGVLWFTLTVEGKATHTSMRGETIRPTGGGEAYGVSAIDKIVLLHQALARLETDWRYTKPHQLFPAGHFSILPGVVVGGPRSGLVPFVIPDEARMDVIVWYHPDEEVGEVEAELEDCIERAAAGDSWLRAHPPRLEWRHHWPKSVLDPGHPIVGAVAWAHEQSTGRPSVVAGFPAVEDTTWLNAAGIPAVSYGPGDLRSAHAVDEHVEISELLDATLTFALLAADWCGVA